MKCAIVIPAYNAAAHVGELVRRVVEVVPEATIIVVDDGSQDKTAEIASRYGVTGLSHEKNRGKGEALKTGFSEAVRLGVDAVIQMDADRQHDPNHLPKFIHAYEETRCDIIIGTRDFSVGGMPWDRRMTNRLTSRAVSRMGGVRIDDSQSGYRLISRRALELVYAPSSNYDFESEFLILAARAGMTVGSIPISTIYAGEKSSIRKWTDTIRFLRLVMKYWWSRPEERIKVLSVL